MTDPTAEIADLIDARAAFRVLLDKHHIDRPSPARECHCGRLWADGATCPGCGGPWDGVSVIADYTAECLTQRKASE